MLAEFRDRHDCICCRSTNTKVVAEGSYDDDPLHGFLAADPWGVSPLPMLVGARWQLRACEDCGMRYHGRILTPEWRTRCLTEWMSLEAIEEFEKNCSSFADLFGRGTYWVGHVHSIVAATGTAQAPRVLDFGCGSGEFLTQMALHGAEAWGVDASAARRTLAGGRHIEIVSTLDALPPSLHGKFDAVTLFEVLEHLDDPRDTLESLRKWVRPGGLLVLTTPDAGHVDDIRTMDDYRAIHPLDHVNAFDRKTLVDIAGRCGFERIERPLAYVATSARQAIRKEARRLVDRVRAGSTQQYFRAV